MPKLTAQEMEQFLTKGAKILKLATITESGYRYVNPLWYMYEGGVFLVAGREKANWVNHIKNNNRVSVCVDTYNAPYTRVIAEADADILDDSWLGDWEHWPTDILAREKDINNTNRQNTYQGFWSSLLREKLSLGEDQDGILGTKSEELEASLIRLRRVGSRSPFYCRLWSHIKTFFGRGRLRFPYVWNQPGRVKLGLSFYRFN